MDKTPAVESQSQGSVPIRSAEQLRTALRHGVFFLRRLDNTRELTSQQISLMSMLTDGGVRMTTIAANLGVRTPTATQSVDRLMKSGLVERQPDPADARAVLVKLTRRGHNVIAAEDRHRNEVVAKVLARLDDKELAALDAAMPVLEKLASPRGGMTGEHQPRPGVRRD
ncbi:MarR family winged helix-turn-helix transcriptional regulator [Kocuria carniphila]|uniref:MarR family winged helix-turn-helix transcriptional regulator n=1 Tax=Kocuria carniphila TaxID=262208 RepID=UPI0034CF092E